MYNITNITGDPINLLLNVNNQTNGIWGAGILFSLFAIVFIIVSANHKGSSAIMVSSFVTFIAGIMLIPTGLIDSSWIFAPIILMVISAFFVYRSSGTIDV